MTVRMTDLRNFLEVAEAGSISEAARRLDMAQPSLSESIKRFEKSTEKKVFYRTRKGVSLTPQGRELHKKATLAYSSFLELSPSTQDPRFSEHRVLRIGAHPMVASYSLPQSLSALLSKKYLIKIHIKHGSSAEVQEMIQNGEIDIALVVNPRKVPDLIITQLAEDTVSVWSKKKNFQSNKLICNPKIFQTQSIIKKWKNAPSEIIESKSLEFISRLVDSGIGFGIIPGRIIKLLQLKLHKNTTLPSYTDKIALVYRPEFGKNEFEKEVVTAIKKSLK